MTEKTKTMSEVSHTDPNQMNEDVNTVFARGKDSSDNTAEE